MRGGRWDLGAGGSKLSSSPSVGYEDGPQMYKGNSTYTHVEYKDIRDFTVV